MTTVTITPMAVTAPSPNVEVFLSAVDAGVATVTVWRTVRGRTMKVRGLVNVPAASGVSGLDFEVPPGYAASYSAQQFDSSGNFVSYTTPVAVTLPDLGRNLAWFHNPLDPTTAVQMKMAEGSGAALVRATNASVQAVQGRSVGVAMFGVRGGLKQVVLDCVAETAAQADAFDALFGAYDDVTTVPILCIRTPSIMRLPSPLFAVVGDPAQMPANFANGGSATQFGLTGDEVSPPPEAVVVTLLGYDDFTAFYADYAAFTAAYPDYQTATRDYSIAGTV